MSSITDLVLSIVLSCAAPGTDAPPSPAAAVDAFVASAMDEFSIPGVAVVVTKDGKSVVEKGYGLASVELGVPVRSDTVFALASITKAFTATLVMKLVEDGTIALDAPIGSLLEDLPEAWRGVTVAELLSHTSGLPDTIVDPMAGTWIGATRDESIRKVAALPMASAPGTTWSYNQTNYVLLGMLLEEKGDGSTVEEMIDERFVKPLQLERTAFGDSSELVPGRATWYSRVEISNGAPRLARVAHPAWVLYPKFARTCAGLNASAVDLARFVDALASGKILAPATRDRMWSRAKLRDGRPCVVDGDLGMGLGVMVEDRGGHRAIGGSGGASVAFRHYPDDALTVIVLTNCQGVDPDALVHGVAACFVPALGERAK